MKTITLILMLVLLVPSAMGIVAVLINMAAILKVLQAITTATIQAMVVAPLMKVRTAAFFGCF